MKKSIINILAAGTVLLAMAACSKEKDTLEVPVENTGLVTESLTAVKEGDATKITMNSSLQFGWSNRDKAAFSIFNGTGYDFVDSDFYGATVANKFTISHSGIRRGFTVIPSTFAQSLSDDGNTLTVTYPANYDISADVAAGCYDNADGAHFIPFPMVAASTNANTNLNFYSIGALVKVVMSHVPAGTKNLYITFNKKVTGDFEVSDPGTSTSAVTVSDNTPSTVTVKISESGLAEEKTLTLYIPVPTTTDLRIMSVPDASKKATVARNQGYQFAVDAITRTTGGTPSHRTRYYSDYQDFYLSPGNLVRYKEGGQIKYTFYGGYDQLKTTSGSNTNNPHRSFQSALENVTNNGDYVDTFNWDDLYQTFMGTPSAGGAETISNAITIDGVDWYVPTSDQMKNLYIGNSWRSFAGTVYVSGERGAVYRTVSVNVTGSPYANYATFESTAGSGSYDRIRGKLFFPDGYVDQTDLVSALPQDAGVNTITYDQWKKMIDAGADFLIAAGVYNTVTGEINQAEFNNAYWLKQSESTTSAYWMYGQDRMGTGVGSKTPYNLSVRLIRWTSTPIE